MPMRSEIAIAGTALLCTASLAQAGTDWPSYNRTVTSDRYATVEKIDNKNVAGLKVVCIGNAGGDNKGVKGRMYALDDKDGHIVWEFYLVPRGPGDVARGPAAPDPKSVYAATWKETKGFPITGGATWTSYSLDPVTGLLYIPAGHPAPRLLNETPPRGDLFARSILVLGDHTGAYPPPF